MPRWRCERLGHHLTDCLGSGELRARELALDVVEQAHQADDLLVNQQRQRHAALLPVAAHVLPLHRAQPGVIEAADSYGVARLDCQPLAGPVLQADLLTDPGVVVGAVDGRGEADEALAVLEPVDVAGAEPEGGAQASRRRLQDLGEL